MKIVLSSRAEKTLKKLPKIDQIAIARKIRLLREGQPTTQIEKLKSFPNIFRLRIGNYRVVYRRLPQETYIILIAHRKDIYDLLRRLF